MMLYVVIIYFSLKWKRAFHHPRPIVIMEASGENVRNLKEVVFVLAKVEISSYLG
jgi:hypothetical protein